MWLFVMLALAADTLNLPWRVDSVTFYRKSAVVWGEATLEAGPGTAVLALRGLPPDVEPFSLRVPEEIEVLGLQVQQEAIPFEQRDRIRWLQAEIHRLERKIREIQDEMDALGEAESLVVFFRKVQAEALRKEGGLPANPEAWRQAVAFVREEILRLRAQLRALEEERKAREDTLKARKEVYQQLTGGEKPQSLFLPVVVTRSGTFSLGFSFVTGRAGWEPAYVLRAFPDEGRVRLDYRAKLHQQTGLDWEGVRAILSTGEGPLKPGPVPTPEPWIVQEPYPERPFLAERAPLKKPSPAVRPALGFFLRLPDPLYIPSGPLPTLAEVQEIELRGDIWYYAVPSRASRAYLRYEGENTSPYPLVAGQARAFVEGEFTGTFSVPLTTPGDSLKLFLGPDPFFPAQRKLVSVRHRIVGILSKKRRSEYHYRYTVENRKSRPHRVRIQEGLPTSRVDWIQVVDLRVEPPPDSLDPEGNIATWDRVIPPREAFVIDLKFAVERPLGRP